MKKYLIILLALLTLGIVGAYIGLLTKGISYHKTIGSSSSSVLILDNFDKTNIRIVTGKTDIITADLTGSDEDLKGIKIEEDGIFAKFGFSSDFSNISGTITVPEGTLLDITLSEDRTLRISDAEGERNVSAVQSFLVDTTELSSFDAGSSDSLILDGWGALIVWDDNAWKILDGNGDGNVAENENEVEVPGLVYCGVGPQSIRNYCCENENSETAVPFCNGLGYWIFDNVVRACDYTCEAATQEEEEQVEVDCGIGGQSERNTCCATQNAGEYQGCLGSWLYNNASQSCAFDCDVFDPSEPSNGGGGEGVTFGDPISDYCYAISDEPTRDLCCNDALKNALSSGPRPGFPQCIGKYYFNAESGCEFACSDHVEMMEILEEIRQNAQSQQ